MIDYFVWTQVVTAPTVLAERPDADAPPAPVEPRSRSGHFREVVGSHGRPLPHRTDHRGR